MLRGGRIKLERSRGKFETAVVPRARKRCGEAGGDAIGEELEMADTLGLVANTSNTPLVQNTRVFQQRERWQFEASLLFDPLKGGTGRPGIMGGLVEQQATKCGEKRPALDQEDSHFDASTAGLRNEPCAGHTHQPARRITHRRSPDPCFLCSQTPPPSLGAGRQG